MSVRHWINNNPAAAGVGAILAVALVIGFVFWQGAGTGVGGDSDVYYYDPQTGELFVDLADHLPPIETPSGGSDGARAYIYACEGCPGESFEGKTPGEIEEAGAFVGYLLQYDAEARRILLEARDDEQGEPLTLEQDQRITNAEERGQMVRRLEDGEGGWVPAYQRSAEAIMEQVHQRCEGGARPPECRP